MWGSQGADFAKSQGVAWGGPFIKGATLSINNTVERPTISERHKLEFVYVIFACAVPFSPSNIFLISPIP